MGLKPTSLAGWCLFVLLLFLSAFYVVSGHLLSMPGTWGPRFSIALTESVAFFGGAVLLRVLTKDRKLNRRLRPASHVYMSFTLLTGITAALGLFLFNVGLAHIVHEPYRGLDAFYPMLSRTVDVPTGIVVVTLVVIPALVQEVFLRGTLFSLFEKQGTATALVMSTVCMPMLYVYPSAAPLVLVIGFLCALETYYTNSIWPAVFTHMLCRLTLYGGDLLYASEAFAGRTVIVVAVAIVLFLLFLFSLLRSCEGLLRDGLLEHFQKGPERTAENLWTSFKTLGFLLFLLLYITRLVMILLGMWR